MNEIIETTLRGAELVVCCGAGGVGKTSSAAALGMTAASYGRRVVVITIDPAKRLAQALGMTTLGNEPVPIPLPDADAKGSLHALMLDPKATFDAMVARTIKIEAMQRALQGNHLYKLLTQAFHGMQEYMAVERLFALLEDKRFDLVVLDTPPTTNVLQFFDAPERLARFFDRRIVRWFIPNETSALKRLLSGQSAAMLLIQKVAGEDFARDLQEFFTSMGGLADALSSRAAALGSLLGRASTRYVVVTGPEASRVDETLSMIDLLRGRAYRPSAVIVNRVTPESTASDAPFQAPGTLGAEEQSLFQLLAKKLDAQRATLLERARREKVQIDRLRARLGETLVRVVPRLDVELDSALGISVLARALG